MQELGNTQQSAATGVGRDESDAALLHLLREQPQAATAALYDRYGNAVFSVALRIVGDRGAAEEITQDVFVGCWRHASRYQSSRGSLLTWLLGITHNRAIDELRSKRHQARLRELSWDAPVAQDVPGERQVDAHLLQEDVRTALADLPPAQREVIELLYFGGLTRREAADHLSAPLGTVHTRLRLGMNKLRQSLAHWLDDSVLAPEADYSDPPS